MKVMSWTRSPFEWLARLVWGSFWSLPAVMIATTLLALGLLLHFDAEGASAALGAMGWPLSISGSVAQEVASALVGIHAALVALYFSISLTVLTLAAGNLGVRLVDIWIARTVTRATLGLLLSGLAATITLLMAVDPDAHGAHVARLSVVAMAALTIILLGWLAFALHDLGRTIHIDTVIAYLRRSVVDNASDFQGCVEAPAAIDWNDGAVIASPRSGFVESIDFDSLVDAARERDACIEVSALPGDYRIEGEALGRIIGERSDIDALANRFSIGGFRSSSEGANFEVRLLVEIAARALSPAINDFYTALACVDALGSAMVAHGRLRQLSPWLGDEAGTARVYVDLKPFEDLFDAPLKALRQAAAAYPAVAVHLILILRRARQQVDDDGVRDLIEAHAEAMRAHAIQSSDFLPDRQAIERAITAPLPPVAS